MTKNPAMRRTSGVGSTTEWAVERPVDMGRVLSALLDAVEGLHVDVREAEDRDEQDDREGRGIAGAPLLERFALQGDGSDLGRRSGAAAGQKIDHVEHL